MPRPFTCGAPSARREATEELIAESVLTDSRRFTVRVHDGIVMLTGCLETDEAGRELVEAARHIDGAIAAQDKLDHAGTPR